jgi:type IV secretion system protein VirD4
MLSIQTMGTLLGIGALLPPIMDILIDAKFGNKLVGHNELTGLSGDGLILSENVRISPHMSKEHLLVVYPSGGGKSRGIIMPNARELKNCSMLITDPSGEVLESCPRDDMETYVYNLNDIDKSNIGYDPLVNCFNTSEVRQIMEMIMITGSNSVKDQTTQSDKSDWIERSLPLLYAYAIYNWNEEKYPFDVMIINLMTRPLFKSRQEKQGKKNKEDKDKRPESIEEEIMNSKWDEAKMEFVSFAQIAESPVTLACIRDTINSTLRIFKEPNVRSLCRKPTLNFKIMRDKPIIFYIQIPEHHSKHYSPISATLIQQLTNKLFDYKYKPNEGLDVYYLFDEFCNNGKVNDITSYLSTCRKRQISITACVQNLIQLKKIYGEIEGKELQELFKTVITCGGLKDSSEYFSKLLGDKEVKENGVKVKKPIKTPEELRQLKDKDMIILCKNKRPVKDKMYKFS